MEERRGLGRLDRWIRIDADGSVAVFTSKVEIGQGVTTALAQCVADELDVPIGRVRMTVPDTDHSPDEGFTAGSRSIEESGQTLRHVCAEVRALLVERAAARLAVDAASLTVADGVIRSPSGARVRYEELAGELLLAREASGRVPPKAAAARAVIGTRVPRLDLEAKVTGAPAFVQDLKLPGMLHGRVVRPPSPGARLVGVDEARLQDLEGVVAVVHDGSFLGIVAEGEAQAIRARQHAMRIASWEERPTLPADTDPRYLLGEVSQQRVASERPDEGAPSGGARTFSAEFRKPFIAHGALGPSCAVAVQDGGYTIWSHAQGIHPLRAELSKVLGVGADRVRVIHMDGAGCYGHNGADDVALDAALLARAVPGRPVRVQWMRDDEFAWEPYGTATVVRVEARLESDGRLGWWRHDMWGHGHGNRPGRSSDPAVSGLLAARHLERALRPTVPGPARDLRSAALRNALPLYRIPAHAVVDHYLPEQPLRVSALRSLGAHANVFAIESFMNELAAAAGRDPVAFRLDHLDDPRARAVIEAVAAKAGVAEPRAGGDEMRGRGVAFARYKNLAAYFACIAEVSLGQDIRVERIWGAIDAGMAVSPDGVVNQAEGGIVQATSWTLKERVTYDATRVTSLGWDTYPTLTFSEVPEVDVTLIDRPDEPPLGVGEAFAGPVSAAIANAVQDATGVRLRDLPLTRERLIAAMDLAAPALAAR